MSHKMAKTHRVLFKFEMYIYNPCIHPTKLREKIARLVIDIRKTQFNKEYMGNPHFRLQEVGSFR